MGLKIRVSSNNGRKQTTSIKERKIQEKLSYNHIKEPKTTATTISISQDIESDSEYQSEQTTSIPSQQLQNQQRSQQNCTQHSPSNVQQLNRNHEKVERKKDNSIQGVAVEIKCHKLVGQIRYKNRSNKYKQDQVKNKTEHNNTDNNSEQNQSIEEQVIQFYQSRIESLDVRSTLKSYLRRTLDTIIFSNDNDKIFLLEIRKQLKLSQRIATKQEYSEFLKIVDNLYLLAVDKYICQLNGTIPSSNNNNSSPSAASHESSLSFESSATDSNPRTSPPNFASSLLRLSTSNSTEIVRLLQRNALQRLAQAYRRVSSIANNRINNNTNNNNIMGSIGNTYQSVLRDNYVTSSFNTRNDSPSQTENNNNRNEHVLEEEDDLIELMRDDSINPERREYILNSNRTGIGMNSGMMRGRFNGVRSNSRQVTANSGDSSIFTSSSSQSDIPSNH